MIAFMAAGLAVAGGVTFTILFGSLADRVDDELHQEVEELRVVADHRAEQGEPFTDVSDLLRAATEAAVPSRHESVLTLVDGEPSYRPRSQDFDLSSPEVLTEIYAHHEPGRTVYFTTETPTTGQLRMVVASVRVEGDPQEGMFVVASAIGAQRAEVWTTVRDYTAVSLGTLIIAGLVGWIVAGRLFRPLADLREASSLISVDELGRRVPVPDSEDDIADLAGNFNRMLDRLEEGYHDQHQFLRDVGHELRTPITIVHGTIETMDPEDPADYQESRTIALEELERMGRLVGDLSVLAQLGHPNFLQVAEVDMAQFGEDLLARLQHLDDRPWLLDRAAPVTATVDAQRLTQAVVQLGANAVRYSDPDSPISLSVDARTSTEGTQIAISVVDRGVGIEPADQARVFEKFVRLDSSRDQSGSGLGLSIVHAIAEAHQGRVEVESVPGQGSRFTLLIPQHPPEATRPTDTTRSSATTRPVRTDRSGPDRSVRPEESRAHSDR